jgi:7-keto-8-aminopelargonate synthetase-like enzyme
LAWTPIDNPKKTDKIRKVTPPPSLPIKREDGWGVKNLTSQEEKFIESSGHRRQLRGYKTLGYDIGMSETPIIPVLIKNTMETYQMCKLLFENGVFVNSVISPAVSPGRELLRSSYMATHTEEQLDKVLAAFEKVGRQLAVI